MTRTPEELSADPEARRQATDREVALFLHNAEIAIAKEEAESRGEKKGRADLLLKQLQCKFGNMPDAVRERVTGASDEETSVWAERILFAASLDDVFQGPAR